MELLDIRGDPGSVIAHGEGKLTVSVAVIEPGEELAAVTAMIGELWMVVAGMRIFGIRPMLAAGLGCIAVTLAMMSSFTTDTRESIIMFCGLLQGIGMGLAAGLAGLGQGKVAGAVAEALARSPGARPGIQLALFIGLAFIESLVLFTFVLLFIRT